MKITSLEIKNFLGARSIALSLPRAINLIVGKNGSGKSSIQEAVRMALTGEAVRVGLKKDYAQLMTEGTDAAFADVVTESDGACSIILPSGKGKALSLSGHSVLPYVLDAQRFASLELNLRRSFLFGLMGLSFSTDDIKKRLIAKGCDAQKIDDIMPLLRLGFESAHKQTLDKAKDYKVVWRTLTGEIYGEKKAADWKAVKPEFNSAELAALQQKIVDTDITLAEANQHLGAMLSAQKQHADSSKRLAELQEKVSRRDRIIEKLAHDETELKVWQVKVEETRLKVGGDVSINPSLTCPHCNGKTSMLNGELIKLADQAKTHDADAVAKLPEYEKALALIQRAVANGKRDLAESEAAARTLEELGAVISTSCDDDAINAAHKHLQELKMTRNSHAAKLSVLQDVERKSKQADELTTKALAAHEAVVEFIAIADQLAPDGIQGEMLSEALTPLNERLQQSAIVSSWMPVTIDNSMQILADGRAYALLSESEQWRTDAMVAEAISYLSKTKLLVLDRFDVLDMTGREDLIAWLDTLAKDGDIDTGLIFGTLKALPSGLPETMQAHWIENGVSGQIREVA